MGSFVIFALLILSYLFTWGVWYPTTLLINSNWSKMVRERNRWEIRTKQNKKKKKRVSHDPSVNYFHHRREKEKKQEKEEGWREKKMEILFWFTSLIFFFFFFMKVYLSHLDVTSAHGFILHMIYYFLACWFLFFLFF